ncbi:MAG: SRPBCC domain-containing protein [Bacteroidetes bacterium]|nr:SRPBCC domain-containing protein [Bacteroidota bacterium]
MNTSDLTLTIAVPQSPAEVFQCLTHVSSWWSKDYSGKSADLGDEFIIHHPGRHYSLQRLTEVVPGKKMVWLVTDSRLDWLERDQSEWTGTRMIFEISVADGKTFLHFTHQGLQPQKECYDKCRSGWDIVIRDWLYHYITEGNREH